MHFLQHLRLCHICYIYKFWYKVRSATACSQATATNLSAPHLSVYLTVNSLAKLVSDKKKSNWPIVQRVFWNGSFQKRRLELNWVSPPDRRESDFVGLYRFVGPSAPLFIKTAKFGLRQRFSILLLMVFQECKLDISYFSAAKPCAWKSNHFPNSRTWCSGLVCLQTTMNIQR